MLYTISRQTISGLWKSKKEFTCNKRQKRDCALFDTAPTTTRLIEADRQNLKTIVNVDK